MSTNFNDRIAQVNARIDKLTTKLSRNLARLDKQQAVLNGLDVNSNEYYWQQYEYNDLAKSTMFLNKDIEKAQNDLATLLSRKEASEKLGNVECPILNEFLENWFDKALSYTQDEYHRYLEHLADWQNDTSRDGLTRIQQARNYSEHAQWVKRNFSQLVLLARTNFRKNTVGALDFIEKELQAEKKRKREDFIKRLTKVVGTIIDCSSLYIGIDGNINGVVTGTLGKASVQTVGAGGYAIQCYHYRVLIHSIK